MTVSWLQYCGIVFQTQLVYHWFDSVNLNHILTLSFSSLHWIVTNLLVSPYRAVYCIHFFNCLSLYNLEFYYFFPQIQRPELFIVIEDVSVLKFSTEKCDFPCSQFSSQWCSVFCWLGLSFFGSCQVQNWHF